MRKFKVAGIFCMLALTITAFASAGSAYAANPEALLLEAKGGFSFTSGAGELVDPASLLAIKCKSDKGSGTITGAKTLTASVTFEKCNVGGLAAQSLGGKSGIISLANQPGKLCYINAAAKDVGVLLTLSEPVHIEVPSLGELLVVTGSVVSLIETNNVASNKGTLTFGGNKKCEGAEKPEDELLLELEHSGTTLPSEEVSTESITYAGLVELMA